VRQSVLRLGTRKSPMALAQSGHVARLIAARTGRQVELVGLTSFGDVTQVHLPDIGGTGVFVSALRESLVHGDVDLAVHSLKDLPTAPLPGIVLAAVPAREDPRDALAAKDGAKLADLPTGAMIGTGSPRRAAQLRLMRPDVRPVPVRGNAGTRLAKVASGELDAVILAYAGLARIGALEEVSEVFEPDAMIPAPGQGALAVECLDAAGDLVALLAEVDDPGSRAAVTAERTVLAELEAGCSAPLGAYAAGTDILQLTAAVVAEDGMAAVRASMSGPAAQAARLGREVAEELRRQGAGRIVAGPTAMGAPGKRAPDPAMPPGALGDGDDAQ
jgi:hydroxymethylbilane synthase